jgi:hypothetical protein
VDPVDQDPDSDPDPQHWKDDNLPIRHKTVYSRNMSHRICTVRIFSIHDTQDSPTFIPLLGKKTKEQKQRERKKTNEMRICAQLKLSFLDYKSSVHTPSGQKSTGVIYIYMCRNM